MNIFELRHKLKRIELELRSLEDTASQIERSLDVPLYAVSDLIAGAANRVEEARGWLEQ